MLSSGGRGFYDPRSEMNRLFDEVFGGLNRRSGGQQQRAQGDAEWAPAIDVVQKNGDLMVRAELPGVKLEDVEMTVHQGVLTISGKRDEQREEERGGYLVRERRSGSFRRSLQLPEGVDENSIRVRFENGVLEVSIKGAAAAQGPSASRSRARAVKAPVARAQAARSGRQTEASRGLGCSEHRPL